MLGDAILALLFLLIAGIIVCMLLALLGATAGYALAIWRDVRDEWRRR